LEVPVQAPPLPVGLNPLQLAEMLNTRIANAIAYTRHRRTTFRSASSALKLGTIALSAASTIILGVQDLDFWTGVGFALVALATVGAAIEPFFNWRSRWVLMEEQLHRFYRLQADLAMTVASTGEDRLTQATVEGFYHEYRDIWDSTSQRWLEYRRQSERG
jgi:hypothetical protein